MPWLPDDQMADIHIIRQDYAKARNISDANPTIENLTATADVADRRARAIRSLHRDDNATIKQLSSMFRCNKNVIREALAAEEDQA